MKKKQKKPESKCGCPCHEDKRWDCPYCYHETEHKIGEHGAIGMIVRKGNKIMRICCECNKPIVGPKCGVCEGQGGIGDCICSNCDGRGFEPKQSSKCARCKKPYVIKNIQICNCTGILNWQSSSWEKEAKDIACRAGIDHVAYTYKKICNLLFAQQQERKEKLRKKKKKIREYLARGMCADNCRGAESFQETVLDLLK